MGVVLNTDMPTSTAMVSMEAKVCTGKRASNAKNIPVKNFFIAIILQILIHSLSIYKLLHN